MCLYFQVGNSHRCMHEITSISGEKARPGRHPLQFFLWAKLGLTIYFMRNRKLCFSVLGGWISSNEIQYPIKRTTVPYKCCGRFGVFWGFRSWPIDLIPQDVLFFSPSAVWVLEDVIVFLRNELASCKGLISWSEQSIRDCCKEKLGCFLFSSWLIFYIGRGVDLDFVSTFCWEV